MTLPLVISAAKVATISMPNIRENYTKKEYPHEPYFVVSTENPKTHKHKRSKTVKKGKNKRRSNHSQNTSVQQLNDCEATLGFYKVTRRKNRRNEAESNSLNTRHNNDINTTPSVVFCTVKKLISSYAPKKHSSPKPTQAIVASSSSSPRRPQTCISKPSSTGTQDVNTKLMKMSCCPPLRQSQSPCARPRNVRIRKVYYSEPQSQTHAGIPCAPPATPLNDVLITVEIVPCMADIKSQQAIKAKLKNIEIQRKKANEKMQDRVVKEEKKREQQQRENTRQQRRAEIYALNKVMTDLERNKFLQFMKEKSRGATICLHKQLDLVAI